MKVLKGFYYLKEEKIKEVININGISSKVKAENEKKVRKILISEAYDVLCGEDFYYNKKSLKSKIRRQKNKFSCF